MTDPKPELRVVGPPHADSETATLELIARARRSLAEARTLPDIRRVMEAASVAADAAQRAARLAEAQRAAAAVVDAANAAADDAAAVRIEAQAKAGELLVQLRDSGQRQPRGGKSHAATFSNLNDLGVSKSESARWQRVAAIPAEVRRDYVEQAKAERQEVSTAGLLRFAAPATADDRTAVAAAARRQIRTVYRHLVEVPGLRPEALVIALDRPERRRLLHALRQFPAWIEDVIGELEVHHVHAEE